MNTKSTAPTSHRKAMETRIRWKMQVKICERAESEIDGLSNDRLSLMMDLDSVTELDLEKLLAASKLDFAHDVCGIIRHMDRSSFPGKLTNCFWPRCARQTRGNQ